MRKWVVSENRVLPDDNQWAQQAFYAFFSDIFTVRDAQPANAETLNSDTHILCKTRSGLTARKLVRYIFAVNVCEDSCV